MIKLTHWDWPTQTLLVNPAHISEIFEQKDGRTCIFMSNGSEWYCKESADEVWEKIKEYLDETE